MSPELRVAIKAAKDAGAILRRHFHRAGNRVRFKGQEGPVSDVDMASNRLILRRLAAAFPDDHLLDNYQAVIEELIRAKPSAAKGKYIRSIVMASTMGPGVKVDPSRTRDLVEQEAGAAA